MTAITVVGDAMIDVAIRALEPMQYGADTPSAIDVTPGGAGANIAVWLAALGHDVTLIASVGSDTYGAAMLAQLAQYEVSCHVKEHRDAPTGTCVVLLDENGERSMFPDPGANSLLFQADVAIPPLTAHLHLSGYTLAHPGSSHLVSALSEFPGTSSLDLASATIIGKSPAIYHAATIVDVVFGTTPEFACLPHGLKMAHRVEKSGKDGVVAHVDDVMCEVHAPDVPVVATTGAGDAFAAGYLSVWLSDPHDVDGALVLGTHCAARALSRVAAWPTAIRPER